MLQPVEGERIPEFGYHIVRAEWGRDYATEAALACRDWFFAQTGHDRLVSMVWPTNTASRRVAERVHARMRLFVREVSGTEECLYETRRADLSALRSRHARGRIRGDVCQPGSFVPPSGSIGLTSWK